MNEGMMLIENLKYPINAREGISDFQKIGLISEMIYYSCDEKFIFLEQKFNKEAEKFIQTLPTDDYKNQTIYKTILRFRSESKELYSKLETLIFNLKKSSNDDPSEILSIINGLTPFIINDKYSIIDKSIKSLFAFSDCLKKELFVSNEKMDIYADFCMKFIRNEQLNRILTNYQQELANKLAPILNDSNPNVDINNAYKSVVVINEGIDRFVKFYNKTQNFNDMLVDLYEIEYLMRKTRSSDFVRSVPDFEMDYDKIIEILIDVANSFEKLISSEDEDKLTQKKLENLNRNLAGLMKHKENILLEIENEEDKQTYDKLESLSETIDEILRLRKTLII